MQAQTERLYKDVEFLTNIRPFRNWQNMGALREAYQYIQESFEAAGFETDSQKWQARGNVYTNVLASYLPHKARRLVVGAHYDVAGDQPGADDNASAVAGLLETARLVQANQPALSYGLDFVSYCLEEPPFFYTEEMGSYIHAQSLFEKGAEVMGMICYEMIGYFSDEAGSQSFPMPALADIYPDTANFIIVVGTEEYADFNARFFHAMRKGAAIDVQAIDFPAGVPLAGLSDHSSYWKFGMPALMVNDTSFIRNPHYHEPTDTIETLDFEKMTAVVDAAYQGIIGMG